VNDQTEPTYFVVPFDPTGVMMTARKIAQHLTLAEAKAMQEEATLQGALLLIYQEKPDPATPQPRSEVHDDRP
jgi:hypothetical protein